MRNGSHDFLSWITKRDFFTSDYLDSKVTIIKVSVMSEDISNKQPFAGPPAESKTAAQANKISLKEQQAKNSSANVSLSNAKNIEALQDTPNNPQHPQNKANESSR